MIVGRAVSEQTAPHDALRSMPRRCTMLWHTLLGEAMTRIMLAQSETDEGTREALTALRRLQLFAGLDADALLPLARQLHGRRCRAGERIVEREERGGAAYVILRGRVQVVLESAGGQQFILAQLNAGDHFGEMALLDAEPRSATVVAVEETDLLVLQREPFLLELERRPALMRALLVALSRRLRAANAQVGLLAFGDASVRLARLLLEHAAETPEGLAVTLHQETMGEMTGATRQTVARILGRWRALGHVQTARRATLVLRPEAIAAVAGFREG